MNGNESTQHGMDSSTTRSLRALFFALLTLELSLLAYWYFTPPAFGAFHDLVFKTLPYPYGGDRVEAEQSTTAILLIAHLMIGANLLIVMLGTNQRKVASLLRDLECAPNSGELIRALLFPRAASVWIGLSVASIVIASVFLDTKYGEVPAMLFFLPNILAAVHLIRLSDRAELLGVTPRGTSLFAALSFVVLEIMAMSEGAAMILMLAFIPITACCEIISTKIDRSLLRHRIAI